MINTRYVSLKIAAHLIAFCLIVICSLQNEIFEPIRLIVSIISLTILLLNFKLEGTEKVSNWINILIAILLMSSVVLSCFSINTHNPYSVFHLGFVKSLLLVGISTWLYWTNGIKIRQEKFVTYLPFIFLIYANCYYLIFNFAQIDATDASRHCANSFFLYDLITGSNATKLISSLIFYDFYQPLTYLVTIPFLILFGKSYTAAALSIPIFWLPIGYISTYKYLKNIVRLESSYASIFTFCIFGSVIATSLSKALMLDLPCLAMVCWYNYILAKSGFLKNTKLAFYAGLVFGLGIITKSNFLILGLIPLAVSLTRLIYKTYLQKTKSSALFMNILLHVVGMFIGGGFWYLINNNHFEYTINSVTTLAGKNEGDPYPYSLKSMLVYPAHFLYYFTPIIFSILFIGYATIVISNRRKTYLNILLSGSLVVAYIIGTLTWNKDARTLLPALFYFIPAFLGLVYIKNKYLHIGLIVTVTVITFITNASFIFDDPFHIIKYLTKPAYTLFHKPQHPATKNANEAHYVYKKLYAESFGNEVQALPLFLDTNITFYTNKMYSSQYKPQNLNKQQDLLGLKISFWRDYYWPDYYLLGCKTDSNYLFINILGQQKLIGGDIKVQIYEGGLKQEIYLLPNNGNTLKILINIKSKTVSFALKIDHSFPSGQLAAFSLKLMGDKNYTGFDIPLYTYSVANEQQVYILDKPSAK